MVFLRVLASWWYSVAPKKLFRRKGPFSALAGPDQKNQVPAIMTPTPASAKFLPVESRIDAQATHGHDSRHGKKPHSKGQPVRAPGAAQDDGANGSADELHQDSHRQDGSDGVREPEQQTEYEPGQADGQQ